MRSVVVLVLSWNGAAFLRACLLALRAQEYAGRHAVLVVDNGSADGSADLVAAEFPEVALMRNGRNLGFAGGNNVGLRALWAGAAPAPADFAPGVAVLLNQDTEVAPGWLAGLMGAFARHPQAGMVGCKIYEPDGVTLQHTGGVIRWPTAQGGHRGAGEADAGQYDTEGPVDWATGAALAISGDLPAELRLLDERFHPAYYEDVDMGYRVRAAGREVIYAPGARLTHHESSSLGAQSAAHQRTYHRNRLRFLLRHGPLDAAALAAFAAAEAAEIARWSLARQPGPQGGLPHGPGPTCRPPWPTAATCPTPRRRRPRPAPPCSTCTAPWWPRSAPAAPRVLCLHLRKRRCRHKSLRKVRMSGRAPPPRALLQRIL